MKQSRGSPAAGKEEPGARRFAWLRRWTDPLWVQIVLLIAAVLFIRHFLLAAFSIPSGSMENTLLIGDYLMANKAIYGAPIPLTPWRTPAFRQPRFQDIVVFRPGYNQPVIDVVKRIIGVPADTVAMRAGVVYRNGERLREPYVHDQGIPDGAIAYSGRQVALSPGVDPESYGYHWHLDHLPAGVEAESYRPSRENWGPLVVPEGEYLLLGDNRDQSLDSRYVGFIGRDEIVGRPMFIYYSIDKSADRPFPRLLTAVRWGRIGDLIR
ncbi:MAG: signal peptidase I [Longimicrobiaceae bacterium]